jgi:hypothetical protein
MIVVLLLGSVHLFVPGIIGEYLGQIFWNRSAGLSSSLMKSAAAGKVLKKWEWSCRKKPWGKARCLKQVGLALLFLTSL